MSEPTGARRYGVGGGDAYYDAVRYGGYTGTREQFGRDQAEFAQNAAAVAEAKETVERDTEEVRNTKNTFENTTVPEAIRALNQEGEDQILAITQKGEEVSQQVETVGTEQKDAVANEGRARVRAVEEAGTTQVQNVNDAGITQVGNVNKAGEDQVDAVEQAGADQVQAVTNEGDDQVQRIQDKGDEVIERIPADYTALDQEVDNLKSEINNVDVEYQKNITGWSQGTLDPSTGSTKTDSTRCRTGFIQFLTSIYNKITIAPKESYKVSVSEYSTNAVSGFNGVISAMSDAVREITINPAYYYKIVVGLISNENLTPANVPNDAVIYNYKTLTDRSLSIEGSAADAKETGDRFDFIENVLGKETFDWSVYATEENPTGWMVGSWNSSGEHAPGAGNAICITQRLNKSNFDGTKLIKIEYPGGYTFVIRKYDIATPTVVKEYITASSGDYIPIDPKEDVLYGIYIVGFGTSAQSALDNDYPSSVIVTKYISANIQYKQKITEFERFTIINDRSWGAIGITTAANVELQNLVDTKCIIALPDNYSPTGEPVPLIMFGHGAGGYITDTSWYGNSGNFLTMIRNFVNAGFAVFDVDNTMAQDGGFADWGCLPLMTAYIKAWQYIQKNYNVQHDLLIVSNSMGTCASLNMLKWYGSRIRTAIQIAPRPISKYRYATQTDQKKKEMLVSYGIEPESILTDDTFVIPSDSVFTDDYKGFYQYENIEEVNGIKILPNFKIPPIKVLVGASDSEYLPEVREFYQAVRNSGNYVDYREVAGAGHNISFLPNYPGLTAEAVNWLKRFTI